jgi:GTPase SAR1 family protein
MTVADYEHGKASLDRLIEWWAEAGSADRNEATTRLHLINGLLVDVLGWPKCDVIAETSHDGVFADYSLGLPAVRAIVEAKREGTYFELPAGLGAGVAKLETVIDGNPAVAGAARQVLRYCQDRGVPIAVFTNGHQLVAFVANRGDGVPPLKGRALIFESLEAMRGAFQVLWDNMSPAGIELMRPQATLGDDVSDTPPQKLSARVADYPGYWARNKIATELKTLGELVLQDLVLAPELEPEFLRRCYLTSSELSEYALVSKEILEARYSVIETMEADVAPASARDRGDLSSDLRVDVTAASLGRRPLILLGDVGVGKSIFIRHFVQVDAREVMAKSIVLTVNFGGEPALAADLRGYVMDQFVVQLRDNYELNLEADKFVRGVYEHDLKSFETSVASRLAKSSPQLYLEKEIALLERKLEKRDQHLQASFRHITKSLRRQVVIFLDNIDQRELDFQEQVFLIGQSLAETWPATVFLSLRPETFFRSRTTGSLTAYAPRVFTIAPPSIGTVIRRRLAFCRELVDDADRRRKIIPDALDPQAELLGRYLRVVQSSFSQRPELVEFVENLGGGNVREALAFLDTFVGSGHVNTQKILDIQDETGSYTIPLHEFVRAVIYGDYRYFDPSASPIANVFEISRPDIREHFLLPLILAHVERLGEVGQQEGYVRMRAVMDFGQSLGFAPRQIEFALRHAAARRLLQVSPREATDAGLRYRITTVGAYTYKKLMGTFVYLDAVIVDTPIVDDGVAAEITDCADIEERVARSKTFVGYLNTSWESFACSDHAFDWAQVSSELESDYRRIERTLQRRPS